MLEGEDGIMEEEEIVEAEELEGEDNGEISLHAFKGLTKKSSRWKIRCMREA